MSFFLLLSHLLFLLPLCFDCRSHHNKGFTLERKERVFALLCYLVSFPLPRSLHPHVYMFSINKSIMCLDLHILTLYSIGNKCVFLALSMNKTHLPWCPIRRLTVQQLTVGILGFTSLGISILCYNKCHLNVHSWE